MWFVMIKITNLGKRYRDGTEALKGVTFEMSKKVTAVLGRNGAGKTTLLRILSTQLMPTSGTAKINGYDIIKEAGAIRERIVSIPQEAEPIGILTPWEHMEIYLAAREVPRGEAHALTESAFRLLDIYGEKDKTADELSGGMKRKIFVAMALVSGAEVTFLDEPTVGLDPISRLEVWSAIKRMKGSVILTTHYLEEAKALADEIILIDAGTIASKGTIKEIMKPLKGIMRVEGISKGKMQYKIGNYRISYLSGEEAIEYADKGCEVKTPDLEDLLIIKGIR